MRKFGRKLVKPIGFLAVWALLLWLASSMSYRLDMTHNKTYTLSDKTKEVLLQLRRPITIRSFFQKGTYEAALVEGLLEQYSRYSPYLQYKNIDPYSNPIDAVRYNIFNNGMVIMESGNVRRDLGPLDLFSIDKEDDVFNGENEITNLILSLTKENERALYFSNANGERSLYAIGNSGLTELMKQMEKERLQVYDLNPNLSPVPKGCEVLVIVSPKKPFSGRALRNIDAYLSRGGKLILFLDPFKTSGLEGLLEKRGLEVESLVVVDEASSYFMGSTSVIPLMYAHPVTQKSIDSQLGVVFVQAKPLRKRVGATVDLDYIPLLSSTDTAWGDWTSAQRKERKNPTVAGPFDMGVLLEDVHQANNEKWIVFGDSDFISNDMFSVQGNKDLVMNAVQYLLGEESRVSLQSKRTSLPNLTFTERTLFWVSVACIYMVPALILGLGLLLWWRQRN